MRTLHLLIWTAAALTAASAAQVTVLFFISSDCPISNSYAPEIQRICSDYAGKGVSCSLLYEDPDIDHAAVRAHLAQYGYRSIAASIDADRGAAHRAHATVTPEAVVIGPDGGIRYRGRIDNRYAALGKPRQVVTVRDLRDALDAILAGKPVRTPETQAFGCYIVPADVLEK